MIELKPCPFCGENAGLDFSDKDYNYIDSAGKIIDMGLFYTVKCSNIACGCSIGVYKKPKMAIDAWNNRKACET